MARNKTDDQRGRSSFGLTASGRGWYKRIPGVGLKWIASFSAAPTAAEADQVFADRYGELVAPPTVNAVTVEYACNAVLETKANPRTHADAKVILEQFANAVGPKRLITSVGPMEFTAFNATIARYSLVRRSKIIGVVRSLFNWCIAQQWATAVHYGPAFVQPTKRDMRINRAVRPRRMFTPDQVRKLRDTAVGMTRAAVLLGINGGMGPADISRLTVDQIQGDLLRADRGKTGATRIIPLWPETLAALRALTPLEDGRIFYGRFGGELESLNNRGLVRRFTILCDDCDIPRHGFYTLRRTFRTATDMLPDRRAIDMVMGHVQEDMGGTYVQEVHPDRLRVVTNHVREWLTSPAADASPPRATVTAESKSPRPASRRSPSASSAKTRRDANPE